jgi:uncharacterized heparinase superfamily protein
MQILSWVSGFGEWHPQAWAPELVAERLFAWLCHGKPAFEGGDPVMRPALMRSFGRQARHLHLAAGDLREPNARIKAGAVLTMVGCAGVPESERFLDLGLHAGRSLRRAILARWRTPLARAGKSMRGAVRYDRGG